MATFTYIITYLMFSNHHGALKSLQFMFYWRAGGSVGRVDAPWAETLVLDPIVLGLILGLGSIGCLSSPALSTLIPVKYLPLVPKTSSNKYFINKQLIPV
ncbi:hypothetical protein ILYODFUR_037797 [Ilyodon furcidens]|uniref:Uncharacterized protein n=1 Tax=Ilyodon furcidens TaxID=33524 RepID=A0ABV0UMN2_9TELE